MSPVSTLISWAAVLSSVAASAASPNTLCAGGLPALIASPLAGFAAASSFCTSNFPLPTTTATATAPTSTKTTTASTTTATTTVSTLTITTTVATVTLTTTVATALVTDTVATITSTQTSTATSTASTAITITTTVVAGAQRRGLTSSTSTKPATLSTTTKSSSCTTTKSATLPATTKPSTTTTTSSSGQRQANAFSSMLVLQRAFIGSVCTCLETQITTTTILTPIYTLSLTATSTTPVTATTTTSITATVTASVTTTSIINVTAMSSVTVTTTVISTTTSTTTATVASSGNAYCSNGQPVNGLSPACVASPCSTANLRIEGASDTIYEGVIYAGPRNVTTSSGGTHLCDGTNNGANPSPGSNGISTIDAAANLCGFTYDGTFSNQFDDFFIQRIGSTAQSGNSFWGILNNYVFTPAGGCETEVNPTDELLWAFNAFSVNFFLRVEPTQMPVTMTPGQTRTFNVQGNDGNGNFSPISGATFAGQTSNGNGDVVFTAPTTPGTYRYKATRSDSIRSNAVTILVQG